MVVAHLVVRSHCRDSHTASNTARSGREVPRTTELQPRALVSGVRRLGDEIAKVIQGGLTDAELARGKGQLRGSIVLGLEDPSSRMSRLGKSELVYPRLEPVDDYSQEALVRTLGMASLFSSCPHICGLISTAPQD